MNEMKKLEMEYEKWNYGFHFDILSLFLKIKDHKNISLYQKQYNLVNVFAFLWKSTFFQISCWLFKHLNNTILLFCW